MTEQQRKAFLFATLLIIGGAIFYLEKQKPFISNSDQGSVTIATTQNAPQKNLPRAIELVGGTGFINTLSNVPIHIADLIGKKVILVDFWTYSCINCQRTIPYLNAWYQKYHDQGLEIIGVHTPEFEFEKVYSNVAAAVKKFGIQYPVMLDSNYATWQAYNNQYWPHEFIIDIDGYIADDHIGEGGYAETEQKIKNFLAERMTRLNIAGTISQEISQPAGAIDASRLRVGSPETYFGSARNQYLGNGNQNQTGSQTLAIPDSFETNTLYLGGDWDFTSEYAENTVANAKIVFRYNAKNVYFVASAPQGVNVQVLRDGKPYKKLLIKEDQLYPMIDEQTAGEHTMEIIIESPGLRAYTFTFG